jgi:hypothetical protein
MSVYYHFLARGREVVYPRDRAKVIGLGKREKSADGFWRPFLAKNSEGTSEAKDRSKMQALNAGLEGLHPLLTTHVHS